MALKVIWSPEALEDVESIAEYISRDSRFYAQATVSKIIDITRQLTKFPQIGRILPEFHSKTFRELLVYSYRLVYKIERSKIIIVAVIHDKRSFGKVSERFDL